MFTASAKLLEITKPPPPFCCSSAAKPARVIVLPTRNWVAVELLVSTIRLLINPVKSLLEV